MEAAGIHRGSARDRGAGYGASIEERDDLARPACFGKVRAGPLGRSRRQELPAAASPLENVGVAAAKRGP